MWCGYRRHLGDIESKNRERFLEPALLKKEALTEVKAIWKTFESGLVSRLFPEDK